jgi:membrane protease YdiL (CAAX protease family)
MSAQAPSTTPTPAPPRPAAPAPARRTRFARWRPGVALVAVVAALIGSQIVALALILAAGGRDAPDWLSAAMILVADGVLLGVVIVLARRGADRLGAATLGIRRTAFWPAAGWMFLTYFAVSIFNIVWILLIGTGSVPSGEEGGSGAPSVATIVFVVLGVAIAAPIVEEITFRGYLFPALTRWKGPWIGALTCSVVFGLAHCAVYPPQLLPMMAVFGFVACLLFWFTGSLLPGVALHAMNNSLVTGRDLGWGWEIPLLMIGCMVLCLLLLLPFARERAPETA